jgi:hypothetical protein
MPNIKHKTQNETKEKRSTGTKNMSNTDLTNKRNKQRHVITCTRIAAANISVNLTG